MRQTSPTRATVDALYRLVKRACTTFALPPVVTLLFVPRWVNLWLPETTVTEFTQLSATRRLQKTDSVLRCEFAAPGSNDISVLVFIGNLILVAVILLAIFVLHVTLTSGVEAYWLTKVTPLEHVSPLELVFITEFRTAGRTGFSASRDKVRRTGRLKHRQLENKIYT